MRVRHGPREIAGFPFEAFCAVALLLLGVTVVVGFLAAPRGFALERVSGDLGSLPPVPRTPLFLRMLPDGGLHLDGEAVGLEELVERVRSMSEPGRERVIVVEAADDAPYGAVVSLWDALSQRQAWRGVRPPMLSLPTHRQIAEYVRAYGRDPFLGPAPPTADPGS